MNTQKIVVLLFIWIIYVNYIMHFKKDVDKIEKNIVNYQNRILKEEKLFEERDLYKDINFSKDYSYLFYDGKKLSYSNAMGELQQFIQFSAKETNCTLTHSQWQDMVTSREKEYDILSLKLSFNCTPKSFIDFQNHVRKESKLFTFNQLRFFKNQRKNFLNIITILYAYRSKDDKK